MAWDAPGPLRRGLQARGPPRPGDAERLQRSPDHAGPRWPTWSPRSGAEVVVLSYNNEAWLSFDELHELCAARGHVEVLAFDSARYVGRADRHPRSVRAEGGRASPTSATPSTWWSAGDRATGCGSMVRAVVERAGLGHRLVDRPGARCRFDRASGAPANVGAATSVRRPAPGGRSRATARAHGGDDGHGCTGRTGRDHHRRGPRDRARARPAVRRRGGQGGRQRPRWCGRRLGRRPHRRPSRSSTRSRRRAARRSPTPTTSPTGTAASV